MYRGRPRAHDSTHLHVSLCFRPVLLSLEVNPLPGQHARKQYKTQARARDIRLNHAARVVQRRYRKWAGHRRKKDVVGQAAKYQTVRLCLSTSLEYGSSS
jgi:hypothetical protein